MSNARPGGLLGGTRVIVLARDHVMFAARLLADMGADVIVVEPPGGAPARDLPPHVALADGGRGSVWWEHYAMSARSVVADLATEDGAAFVQRLLRAADIVVEGEPPGRLEDVGLGPAEWCAAVPSLIWASVTTFGHTDPRSADPFSDLTVLAEGGPVWSCGYDDHTLPPVRGLGNQGYQVGCMFAAMASLAALLERTRSGAGQHIDVSLVAAANVSTEMGSYCWLVANETVQRLTGRHAMPYVTTETQVEAADGSWVQTGIAIRGPAAFANLLDWLGEIGAREEFPDTVLLELGAESEPITAAQLGADPVATEIVRAGRDALIFLATRLPGYEFFLGAQRRGLQCGVVLTPPQVLDDPHLQHRGWVMTTDHPRLGSAVRVPGPAFRSSVAPSELRPAPSAGEHQAEVAAELDAAEPSA
ncbi:MAG TPA: CoA transferase [Acidimicrobiales bacterium]|nr:CoA transferase [Acidimicrobiales bacterium]